MKQVLDKVFLFLKQIFVRICLSIHLHVKVGAEGNKEQEERSNDDH